MVHVESMEHIVPASLTPAVLPELKDAPRSDC
jgi:hypothetical protein